MDIGNRWAYARRGYTGWVAWTGPVVGCCFQSSQREQRRTSTLSVLTWRELYLLWSKRVFNRNKFNRRLRKPNEFHFDWILRCFKSTRVNIYFGVLEIFAKLLQQISKSEIYRNVSFWLDLLVFYSVVFNLHEVYHRINICSWTLSKYLKNY